MTKQVFSFGDNAVGMDGEGFLVDKDSNPVSVEGKLGGQKNSPILIKGGGYLEDCVAWEINPDPVAADTYDRHDSARKFADNIETCIKAVSIEAEKLDLSVSITPAQLFGKEQLGTEQSNISGCDISYNAWSLRRHPRANLVGTNWRFASGDIHMSWPNIDDANRFTRANVARYADMFFGCAEVAYTAKTERNKYYGTSGIHRPTSYGVEYKSVGNWWMMSRDRMVWAYLTALQAIEHGLSHDGNEIALNEDSQRIVGIREKWDKTAAAHTMDNWGINRVPAIGQSDRTVKEKTRKTSPSEYYTMGTTSTTNL